jgi:hypothetical protein
MAYHSVSVSQCTLDKTVANNTENSIIKFTTIRKINLGIFWILSQNSNRKVCTSFKKPWLPYILVRICNEFHNTFGYFMSSLQLHTRTYIYVHYIQRAACSPTECKFPVIVAWHIQSHIRPGRSNTWCTNSAWNEFVVCHLKFAWSGSQLIQLLVSLAWYISYLADRQPDKAHLFPTSCNEITSERIMLVISVGNHSLEKPYALIQNAPLAGNMLIRLWNICMLKAQSGPRRDADFVAT